MITIILGPTASGKTKLSIDIAKQHNACIINCDSFQLYKNLPILTAAPTAQEQSNINHALFGIISFDQSMNAVKWAKLAANIISTSDNVVLVGGTFLYVDILLNGICQLPSIPTAIRKHVELVAHASISNLYNTLCRFDNRFIKYLKISNHHQIKRAYEIYMVTGKSIFDFYNKPKVTFLNNDHEIHIRLIDIDRSILYSRINDRFISMIRRGAIDEVQTLLHEANNNTNYPIFKTIGAIEICQFLRHEISMERMIELCCIRSRQYAKRQLTWLRNKFDYSSSKFASVSTISNP